MTMTLELQQNDGPGRRERNRQNRRQFILEVARELFFTKGYAETTMSELANRIGGSKGTLWAYFPSKELLFEAAVVEAVIVLKNDIEENLVASGDLGESLHRLADIFITKLTTKSTISLHRLIVSEGVRFPELGRIFYDHAFHPIHTRLTEFFDAEMKGGKMRECNPEQAAFELICLLQRPQQFLLWNLPAIMAENDRSAYVHASINMFLRSYAI